MEIRRFLATFFLPLTATLEFLQRYFKGILLLLLLLAIIGMAQKPRKANLITISLNGAILDAKGVLRQIEEAKKPNYKGVLFIVNSPGGAVAPSIEISRAIKRLKKRKPVVTYAAGTLASGGYYAAVWSDKIIANPGSIVGSIGVLFQSPMIKELLDKIGVEPQVVKAGRYKEVGTPFRPWKEYERKELEKIIFDTYATFVTEVCEARKLDCNKSSTFADAHIFTARQAKAVGLIDAVGTIDEAKRELIKMAKVKKPIWRRPSPFERLMEKMAREGAKTLYSLLWGMELF